MPKSMERLFEGLTHFFSRLVEDLGQYFDRLRKRNQPLTASIDTGQEELPAVDVMVPLAVERPVIQVECISCGSVVELSGICQKCQGPICTRAFCRRDVYDEELDMRVIQCRNCAVTEQA